MCLNPKWIYKKGFYKDDNYRGYKGQFYEIGTYTKCSVCTQCIAEKANNWVIRNHYESQANEKKCFITLTYANNPFILVRKDVQDFIKRFRFKINETYYKKLNNLKKAFRGEQLQQAKESIKNEFIKTRIFYAGEYGTLHGRSHFHVIIYGWEDENLQYLDINKRGNIIYKSDIIDKTWGLGRTSYQKFNDNEIPYITLYNTAKEEFSKAYKMTLEKAKQIRKIFYTKSNVPHAQKLNLYKTLSEIEKQLKATKDEYYLIKEFNGWSIALGWEKFYEDYAKSPIYDWKEYIADTQFVTPTPWVKKLANMGDIPAAQEMFKREEMIMQSANEEEERAKNEHRELQKRKKELLDWNEKGRKNGEIDDF